jgi:hypothetical protein
MCIVIIEGPEEEDSFHSCEEIYLLAFLPLSRVLALVMAHMEPFIIRALKEKLIAGGPADGRGHQGPGDERQADGGGDAEGDPGVSRDRGIHGYAYLGEHWGGTHLGEHWGPARARYLQGPWVPHQEELDRYVKSFVFIARLIFPFALSLPLLSILLISLSFI